MTMTVGRAAMRLSQSIRRKFGGDEYLQYRELSLGQSANNLDDESEAESASSASECENAAESSESAGETSQEKPLPEFAGVVASLRPTQRAWSFGWGRKLVQRISFRTRRGISMREAAQFDKARVGESTDSLFQVSPHIEYDRFGFETATASAGDDSEGNAAQNSATEDDLRMLKWTAYLDFRGDPSAASESTIDPAGLLERCAGLRKTPALSALIRDGIPHVLRARVWYVLSGGAEKSRRSDMTYDAILALCAKDTSEYQVQIEKDLLRTLPNNVFFSSLRAPGIPRLRRVLAAFCWLYPDIGYCQGMGVIAASLLLVMEEEEAFWTLAAVVEDLLPQRYFSAVLLGAQVDQRVLREFVAEKMPRLDGLLKECEIELPLITLNWFLTIFSNVLSYEILLRVWDCFFNEGSIVLFRMSLAMLMREEDNILRHRDAGGIFNALSDVPGNMTSVDLLLETAFGEVAMEDWDIEAKREPHTKAILAELDDRERWSRPAERRRRPSSPRQQRQAARLFSWPGRTVRVDEKPKNVAHTEKLLALKNSIISVVRHFRMEPPDDNYADESAEYVDVPAGQRQYARRHERQKQREGREDLSKRPRRARARISYRAEANDELGFEANDVITVLNMADEVCWLGEMGERRGWFPSKFVELLDERSKEYESAGDELVTFEVTRLVRGSFCRALKAVLMHGFRPPSGLGAAQHVWDFIVEAVDSDARKENRAKVRVALCRAFRLDDDAKELSPPELLYNAVAKVNATYEDVASQKDVKLRALICHGLNEQCLHAWFEILARSEPSVTRWYEPWSYLRSPVHLQIKCDLKVLSLLSFNLLPDAETTPRQRTDTDAMRDDVRDMLIKYHLFSWEL